MYLAICGEDRLDTDAPREGGAIARGFHAIAAVMGRPQRPALVAKTAILTAETDATVAVAALLDGLRWHLPSSGRDGWRMVLRHWRGYLAVTIAMLRMMLKARRQQKAAGSRA